MAKLKLSKNKETVVDDEDFEYLSKWKWSYSSSGYAVRQNKGKLVSMHRQIIKPKKRLVVDHINGDKLDNTRKNLRICTVSQNCHNSNVHKDSRTGLKGVTFEKQQVNKPWRARIMVRGEKTDLGLFKTKQGAHKAYLSAAQDKQGEFFPNHLFKAELFAN